jgi:hypothetical protein
VDGERGIRTLKVSLAIKDSYLRRMCRLINVFGKVRRGIQQKKDVKKTTSKASMYMKTNKSRTKYL